MKGTSICILIGADGQTQGECTINVGVKSAQIRLGPCIHACMVDGACSCLAFSAKQISVCGAPRTPCTWTSLELFVQNRA